MTQAGRTRGLRKRLAAGCALLALVFAGASLGTNTATAYFGDDTTAYGIASTEPVFHATGLRVWGSGASAENGVLTSATSVSSDVRLPTMRTWTRVSAGESHVCAIDSTGALLCWGDNTDGELGIGSTGGVRQSPVQVGTATDWTWVSTGSFHACGIRSGGSLWCWGLNTAGQIGDNTTTTRPSPVQIAGSWRTVGAGLWSTCGIRTSRELYCWGDNQYGQVGNGSTSTTPVKTPTKVGSATTWDTVSVGGAHVCALQTDAKAWCWGAGDQGQIGNGGTSTVKTPTQIGGTSTWISIDAGFDHTCGVRPDNKGYCWGDSTNHEVANSVADQKSPYQIANTWEQLDAGVNMTCGIRNDTDRTLWCWGLMGTGTNAYQTMVGSYGPSLQTTAGWKNACTIRTDGSLWCVGNDAVGHLGHGAPLTEAAPVGEQLGLTWADGTAGRYGGCGITTAAKLYCWGLNDKGQAGVNNTSVQEWPAAVGTANWRQVTGGTTHTCGIQTSGSLWCWGNNSDGRVGDNTTTQRNAPVQIASGSTWRSVSAGANHTCAIGAGGSAPAGSLWCWGASDKGQLGMASGTYRVPTRVGTATDWTAVSAGSEFTCGIRAATTLWCWGSNTDGRTGYGTTTGTVSTPTQVTAGAGGMRWDQVSAGARHACAIRSDQAIACWGANASGQLGDATTTPQSTPVLAGGTSWNSVSAGQDWTCATKSDDTVWCWGENEFGALGQSDTTDRPTPTRVPRVTADAVRGSARASFVLAVD